MPLVCALNDAVCLRVSGADAGEFLRAQLSRDPPPLAGGAAAGVAADTRVHPEAEPQAQAREPQTQAQAQARELETEADRSALAAWLDARGRVRALFRVVALEQDYMLLAERETAAAVLAKLRMFVLRARVALSIDDGWQAAAVLGRAGETLRADSAARAALRWLPVGPDLAYALGPRQPIADLIARASPADPRVVELAEIRLGLPKLGAALTERYVPQMLNLDLLGAVAFDKGCYPGQEVVARLKYRGSVKRRLRRFAWTAPPRSGRENALPAPGDEVVDLNGESVGEVVRAARADNGVELLAVVQLESIATGLRLAAARDRHATERDSVPTEGGSVPTEGDPVPSEGGAAGLTLEPLPLPYDAADGAAP